MMIGMFKTKPEYVQGVKLQNDKISIIETLVFLGEAIDYTDLLVKVGKAQDEGVLRTSFYGDINFGDVIIKNKKGVVSVLRHGEEKEILDVACKKEWL